MIKYRPQPTARFRKDVKLLKKRGYDLLLLYDVIDKLSKGETLSEQYHDHPLKGNRKGYRDCHILSDWILIYKIDNDILTLVLAETGSHSDLLKK